LDRPSTYRPSVVRAWIAHPLRRAAFLKWERGRERLGDEWHGEHPLVEAAEELMDLYNYTIKCYARWYGVGGREMRPILAMLEGTYEWIQARLAMEGVISLDDLAEGEDE